MAGTLNDLLKATSRSFYLTLRVLPGAIRPQIGVAYLLARTTDTIADTDLVPLEQPLAAPVTLRPASLAPSPRKSAWPICSRARPTPSPTPASSRWNNGSTRLKDCANAFWARPLHRRGVADGKRGDCR